MGRHRGLFLFAPVIVLIVLSVACAYNSASEQPPDTATPKAVATTVQIAALAREVAGDKIELRGIVPPGVDAHEFEPSASDVAAIEEASLILRNGLGLDDWLDDTLKAGRGRIVTVTDGVSPRKGEEEGKAVNDPHVWHDPDNDKIIVDNIASALAGMDPANKAVYETNASRYKAKLDETKDKIHAIIDTIPTGDRKMVTNHDSLGYFAEAFGLQIVGAVIPSVSTQAETSAKDAASLIDAIRRENVKAVFAESSVNPKLARTLAQEAGVKVVDDLYGDSLGEPGSGAETIDGMLLANANKIADGLR